MTMQEVIAYLQTPKTFSQLSEKYGAGIRACLTRLQKKKLIRTFQGANAHSHVKHARVIVTHYVADRGTPYIPRKKYPRCPCCGGPMKKEPYEAIV